MLYYIAGLLHLPVPVFADLLAERQVVQEFNAVGVQPTLLKYYVVPAHIIQGQLPTPSAKFLITVIFSFRSGFFSIAVFACSEESTILHT